MSVEKVYNSVVALKREVGDLVYDRDYRSARKWCREQFGPYGVAGQKSMWRAECFYVIANETNTTLISEYRFHFRDPNHAMLFALRWV